MAANETSHPQDEGTMTVFMSFLRGDQEWSLVRLSIMGFFAFIALLASILVEEFWRYLLVPFSAVILAFIAGAQYTRDIYEVDSFWQAFRYLFASFFGILYPHVNISHGKVSKKGEEENILELIGGPGYVTVRLGNAVLYEGESSPTAIHPNGRHFIPRFERIQPIALEPQYGEIEDISGMTRDGFDVRIANTRFRFQLYVDKGMRSRENPYPYSEDAIYEMVYNRTVSEKGLGDWASGVGSEIRKVLIGYINRSTLDHLTAPEETGADPRGEIKKILHSQAFTEKLHRRGAELLWIDIGNFTIPNKQVEQQRLNTWQAKWMGDARLIRSYGEAQRLTYQEIGRAEAQAEMLISIMHALSDVNLESGTRQSLRDVILVRTAQLLDAMGENLPTQGKLLLDHDTGKKD
jgi:hypothetical protein